MIVGLNRSFDLKSNGKWSEAEASQENSLTPIEANWSNQIFVENKVEINLAPILIRNERRRAVK